MITYSVDVINKLKEAGYSSYKIRQDKLINETQLQKLRSGELVSEKTLNTVCQLLKCQPGDFLIYKED